MIWIRIACLVVGDLCLIQQTGRAGRQLARIMKTPTGPVFGFCCVKVTFSRVSASHCRSDACESTVEVVTPYWAANSSGKVRAIVNTQHFEQAVHQEVCS